MPQDPKSIQQEIVVLGRTRYGGCGAGLELIGQSVRSSERLSTPGAVNRSGFAGGLGSDTMLTSYCRIGRSSV